MILLRYFGIAHFCASRILHISVAFYFMRTLDYTLVRTCLRQRIPASDFLDHNTSLILNENVQVKICNDLVDIAKLNPYYVKLFLGHYIRLLERSGAVAEAIYELYCDSIILNAKELPPTATDILHYVVQSNGATVAIQESPKLLSGSGTTGLRTWEAAVYLLYYLCERDLVHGKLVVELGSGTGLVSLALIDKVSEITLTDGDSELVGNLRINFDLNGIKGDVPAKQLLWGTTNREGSDFLQDPPSAQVVVAADVTYDSRIVPELCETISDFLDNGTEYALVAATVRNPATNKVWESGLLRFLWSIVERCENPHLTEMKCWFKNGTPEIRIYKIGKSREAMDL